MLEIIEHLALQNVQTLCLQTHNMLTEASESRLQHRYAVVVKDECTNWIQSLPNKTSIAQDTNSSANVKGLITRTASRGFRKSVPRGTLRRGDR